eukprot:CAMPEP_0198145056 /NCGR_PEP_ID=MMETSP1443-20131203/20772_1 /TAXON_ID=186043 /ORGANISM="Entomoneis sp., Strain CCMP2396" /LENGTH=46 /DNA_ID= /DNA_START= /DNA_END= /DNA_ORIENTATION=
MPLLPFVIDVAVAVAAVVAAVVSSGNSLSYTVTTGGDTAVSTGSQG